MHLCVARYGSCCFTAAQPLTPRTNKALPTSSGLSAPRGGGECHQKALTAKRSASTGVPEALDPKLPTYRKELLCTTLAIPSPGSWTSYPNSRPRPRRRQVTRRAGSKVKGAQQLGLLRTWRAPPARPASGSAQSECGGVTL